MSNWKLAWQYVPVPYEVEIGVLENKTQRFLIPNNLYGNKVKVKFHNYYGADIMELDHVTIGKKKRWSEMITDISVITYQDNTKIEVAPGDSFWSDEIPFVVTPKDDLVVSCYFKKTFSVQSVCCNWSKQTWMSRFLDGDCTKEQMFEGKNSVETFTVFNYEENNADAEAGIWAVALDIESGREAKTIAFFGDSITHMSYFTDAFMKVVREQRPGEVTILNGGIGGNRLAYHAVQVSEIPGEGKLFGESALDRFERDVYSNTCPDIVFIMEGINDCTHGFTFHKGNEIPTPELLWEAIHTLIVKGQKRGSKVVISTILPFGFVGESFRDAAEKIRWETNELIRKNHNLADGFIDLDLLMRDEKDPHMMCDGMHIGDWIHPNKAGGMKIAEKLVQELVAGLERV